MRGVDLQVDRLPIDSLVVSGYSCGLRFDLALHFGKIVESAPRYMMKLSPFLLSFHARWCVRNVHFVSSWPVVTVARQIDELQDERPPGNDSASSGEEISADDVLEHGGLAG
jgi:hypothetical protein